MTLLLEAQTSPGERDMRAEMVRTWRQLDQMDVEAERRVLERVAAMRAEIMDRLAALPTVEIDGTETFASTSLRAFAAELDDVANRFAQRYALELTNDIHQTAAFSDEAHRAALSSLARSMDVPPALISFSPLGVSAEQIEAAVLMNTQAVRGVSQRIVSDVNAEIQRVVFGGQSRDDAVRNIRDMLAADPKWAGKVATGRALGRLTQQAVTIERTSLEMAFNLAADHAYRQSLEELPTLMVEWVATRGPRTCQRCASLNGKRKAPRGTFPGNVIAPPLHSRCRCRLVAWMPDWGPKTVTPQSEIGRQSR